MAEYGLGITTFRDKKKENILKPVYMDTKRGNLFIASKKVNKFVRDEIDWSAVTEYQGYPALGVYEGGQESVAHVYFSTPNKISIKLGTEFKRFKDKTNQDSILLYEFVKSGGVPVLEITIDGGSDISKIQAAMSKATNGQIGGYLTYIYSVRRIVIVNVKEFDGLTAAKFRKLIPTVKRVVKPYGGKITMRQAKVTVI